MKKQLLSFLFCLLLVSAYSQFEVLPPELMIQSHKQHLTERPDYHGDASGFFKSNTSENCTQDSSYIYTQKQLGSRTYFTYDSEGNQVETYTEYLDQNVWTPNYQSFMSYNDDNVLLQFNDQFWNGSEWYELSNKLYSYDVAGNLEVMLGQDWVDGNWQDSYQIINTFDSENMLTTSTLQFWEAAEWLSAGMSVFTYNEDGLLWESTLLNWVDDNWMNESTIIYEYNIQGQVIQEQFSFWSGSEWLPMSLTVNTYDFEGNLIQQISSAWDEDLWVQSSRQDFAYDEYQNLTTSMSYAWLNGSWIGPNVVYESFYTCASVGIETTTSPISLDLYPNPTSGMLNIQPTHASLVRVIDMYGKLVHQERVMANTRASIQLPAARGMYVVRCLYDNGSVISEKILKE